MPGLPGVINGYNEHIAWGFTNIGDSQDIFIETPHPDKPYTFKDGDKWYEAETKSVEIQVKGKEKSETITLVTTKNGVLISENPALSLRWTIQDIESQGLDAILEFNMARNWQEFNLALDNLSAPVLNATYADNLGNIGFRTAGILPQRGTGKGLVPVDGSKQSNRWQSLIKQSQMPTLFNPDSQHIAAANARVNAIGNGILVSADNAAPYRIQRIQDVLSQDKEFSLADMQTLQTDFYDMQAAANSADLTNRV